VAGGTLGERCKRFESIEADRAAMPGLPLLARLDGRAFHTYTRGLRRPFDERLSRTMIDTARTLVAELHARVGYTQSDEITLLWHEPGGVPDALPFSGRFQKLASVLAGLASARFSLLAAERIPERAGQLAVFDARVWTVPTLEDALDVFVWREDDATKNSVSMAASSVAEERTLAGLSTAERHDLLHRHGINWNDYPPFFKRGVYVQRRPRTRALTDEERARIPVEHQPAAGALVTRSDVIEIEMPPLRRVANALGVLVHAEEPRPRA
jgi:tRNA(His) guanylyltransferase